MEGIPKREDGTSTREKSVDFVRWLFAAGAKTSLCLSTHSAY